MRAVKASLFSIPRAGSLRTLTFQGEGGGGRMGGGTLIFSYIRRLESFLGVQNVSIFFRVSEK